MDGRWKTVIILAALVIKVECDVLDELLKKVNEMIVEQIRTNEKVDQLQNELNKKILKIDEKLDKVNEAIIQNFAKAADLNDLHENKDKKAHKEVSNINVGSSTLTSPTTLTITTTTTTTVTTTTTTTTNTVTTTSTTTTTVKTTSTTTPEVIMITGGYPEKDVGQLAELLSPNGTHICELERMPEKRFKHTQSGLISCGGNGNGPGYSCLSFAGGSWKKHGTTLVSRRVSHNSWNQGDKVMLIGGYSSPKTTETISSNGIHQATFNLEHSSRNTCVISLNNSFVVTGGKPARDIITKIVTLYNDAGYVRELPELAQGRWSHSCGFYVNKEHKIVLVVAGGVDMTPTKYGWGTKFLTSSEMLIYDEATAWTWGKPLPSPYLAHPKGVSVGNRFFLTGGRDSNDKYVKDVLMLTEDGDWKVTGSMKYGRSRHGVSTVPGETVEYCK